MSPGAQVAVASAWDRREPEPLLGAAGERERPLIRMLTFTALGLYGVIRWGSLLGPAPTGRLLALLLLSVALAWAGPRLRERSRALLTMLALLALLAAFPLSGVPLGWTLHLRITLTANGIGQGLSALPRVLVPYNGLNQWARVVIVLGAAVLLLDAGLVLAFSSRTLGDLRRAGAALPLIALAVVPSTIARPPLPYLHGLVLFGLVALLIWGERLRKGELAAALSLCAAAGAVAMIGAPALDQHKPWVNYQALAGGFSAANIESFDWSQRYGPLNWPRTGRPVLEVKASSPDYWKAEDLDLFDGRGWVGWTVDTGAPLPSPDPTALTRWTQTLKVTIRSMNTTDLIAAGYASQPTGVPGEVLRGLSPGTWTSDDDLGPGDSYLVQAYTPHPTPVELAAAGDAYPLGPLQGYLSLTMPQPGGLPAQQVLFAPFGSQTAPQNISDVAVITGASAIKDSPYARAFTLAGQLASRSATPYAYVMNVEQYFSKGFRYDEDPPQRQFPLASFLFRDKVGYCQQFAGAMALLLRMGGIPARVAAGFTTGTYQQSTRSWVATDQDAHAWVEAWFPHYGWVRFDPTPPAAPARGGRVSVVAPKASGASSAGPRLTGHGARTPAPTPSTAAHHGHGWPALTALGVATLVLLICAIGLVAMRGLVRPRDPELLAELEHAFARSGRPLAGGVTLAGLERRFRSSPDAAAYIRAIRLQRFAGATEPPTAHQRRAVRAQLRSGLGLAGAVRAMWALPPWRRGAQARRPWHFGA